MTRGCTLDSSTERSEGSSEPTERVRVRVRKRKRRTPAKRPSRRWLYLPVIGGLVVLGALAAFLLARDVMAVRESLEAARSSLSEVQSAVGQLDVEAAAASLQEADEALGVARSRSGGPLWSVAARVPLAGNSIRVVREVVGVATASVQVADQAVEDGAALLAGGLDIQLADARLDLGPIRDARDLVAALPVERLRESLESLEAQSVAWTPQIVRDARDEILRIGSTASEDLGRAEQLLTALPTFLGEGEARRYFVGVQTPAEIRGTGGLIGYWTVLRLEDGQFTFEESEVYDALDDLADIEVDDDADTTDDDQPDGPGTGRIGQLTGDPRDGVDADPAFLQRYEAVAANGLFSNVNVDPDLPTTARVALDLFERRTGERLDGMILVDPVAIEALLAALDRPLDLSGEEIPDGAPPQLAPDEFAQYVTVDVYEEFGDGQSSLRKPMLRTIGDVALATVFSGDWDGEVVTTAIGEAFGGRHLQVFSEDENEQEAFVATNVAGRMAPAPGGDLLAVTANNAVGGKMDVHQTYFTDVGLTFGEPGYDDDGEVVVGRIAEVEVTVDNPLPSEGRDLYVIGNCGIPGSEPGCFNGPPGVNYTWFSVWANDRTVITAEDGAGMGQTTVGSIHGLNVFDRYLETPPEDRASFEMSLQGLSPARLHDDGTVSYTLTWWSQAAVVPHELSMRLTPPEGWSIDWQDADLASDQVELTEDGGDLLLTGSVSRDTTVTVTFTPTD